MKLNKIVSIGAMLLASLSAVKANGTYTIDSWVFDGGSTIAAPYNTATPSTGVGTATALINFSYNGSSYGTANADVYAQSGASTGAGSKAWRIQGTPGTGWNTNAPIGAQGAQFKCSTVGFYQVKLAFDVYATADAETALQVQYNIDGSTNWFNATNISGITVQQNANPTNSVVVGSYVNLAAGWNNGITVDLTGIPGAANNGNLVFRLVNAATGTNCLTTTGAHYNNTSGYWAFDNVKITGVSYDAVAVWTFDDYTKYLASGKNGVWCTNPSAQFGSGTAQSIGFDGTLNGYVTTNFSDIGGLGNPGSSSGLTVGTNMWRLRGGGPNSSANGWSSAAAIGTQGAQFNVSTVNYSNVIVTLDVYFTTQGEAKMCLEYTTDGSTWVNAPNLACTSYSQYITNNPDPSVGGSANTIVGPYFYQTLGQGWFNNCIVDLTGVAAANNNSNFKIRFVNAATGSDCVNYTGGAYNNTSGNCRLDNVAVSGQFSGTIAPVVNAATNATEDQPFTNYFASAETSAGGIWRSNITAVFVNGTQLPASAIITNTASMIAFDPSKATVLQTAGTLNILIFSSGYSNVKLTVPIAAGVATKLSLTSQAKGPSASGGTLTYQPAIAVTDKYGNGTVTAPNTNVVAYASISNSVAGTWILGGDTNQASVGGYMVFTNLTATLVNGLVPATNVAIQIVVSNFNGVGSAPYITNTAAFNIGVAPNPFTLGNLAVMQLDSPSNQNNTTFSILEIKPSVNGQTTPLNITPIPATGPNALRMVNSGTSGRMGLSDDSTLLCFAGFADQSSATSDETFNLNRAVGTLNYTNSYVNQVQYQSVSLGGSQARSACTIDDVNFIVDDKGGLYFGSGNSLNILNQNNNVVVHSFGGLGYILTQKSTALYSGPTMYGFTWSGGVAYPDNSRGYGLPQDPNAQDFYLISTNGGTSYDVLYILDNVSIASGNTNLCVINKYSSSPSSDEGAGDGIVWNSNGAITNYLGADSLFVTTNGSGGAYIYFTTSPTNPVNNSIVMISDTNGWGAPIGIGSSNVVYTASGGAFLKGLAFAPRQSTSVAMLIPPPFLTAQAAAPVSGLINITNTPDDGAWRRNITSVTVNGSPLPASAIVTNQAGKLVLNPAASVLLQTPGTKTIVIAAAGYSTNSVVQTLTVGSASQLVVSSQPTAPLGNGGVLVSQPVITVEDVYGNVVTNSTSITAAANQSTWVLGGTKSVNTTAGVATYSGLTAFCPTNAIMGATIGFTAGALTANSSSFNIPAPFKSTLGGVKIVGGKLTFTFTNFPGLSYTVIATNNLTAPISTWPVVGTAVEGPLGTYNFTNSTPATNGSLYYILRQP
jgi:Protein of unknown function (DUF1533)